jgi:hypothetical protein
MAPEVHAGSLLPTNDMNLRKDCWLYILRVPCAPRQQRERKEMYLGHAIGSLAATAALFATFAAAQAESKHPNLKGQWNTLSPRGSFDPDKPPGRATLAPLTEEYKKVYEWNVADQLAGGHGWETSYQCLPPGMPRAMIAYESMEVVVTPETTYILIDHIHDHRRIFTDGRTFPANTDDIEPSFRGFSIGKWIDEGNTGTYNVLEVETRGFKGPRSYDTSGLPLHADNKTVVKERIFLDKENPNILYDEITTIDNALAQPWKVTRKYQRDAEIKHPWWREVVCTENNQHVHIQDQNYMISADGYLMPAKKGQEPPDLKYFK